MKNLINILLSFTCLFLSFTTIAQTNEELEELESYLNTLDFETISNKPYWKTATDTLTHNTWIRGELDKSLLLFPLIFQIPSSHLTNYDLYLYNQDKLHLVEKNSDSQGHFIKTRYPQYYFVTDNPIYYLNIKQKLPDGLRVIVAERSQYASQESIKLLRVGFYYGLALMSLIFNFIFFLIFKDKRFLAYCFLQLGIFTSFLFEDGIFYFFSNASWNMKYLLTWNIPITALFACVFSYYFLDIKKTFPNAKRYFIILISMALLGSLIHTITDNSIAYLVINLGSFFAAGFCILVAFINFKKDVYARFLILTFGVILIFGLGYALHINIDADRYAFFNVTTFRIISAMEIIAISFAIIFKARKLQQDNENYRTELSKYLQHLGNTPNNNTGHVHIEKGSMLANLKESHKLTDRETEVLEALWEGLSNQQISDRLLISLSTTKYHVGNLYSKLEVKNRSQALVIKDKIAEQSHAV